MNNLYLKELEAHYAVQTEAPSQGPDEFIRDLGKGRKKNTKLNVMLGDFLVQRFQDRIFFFELIYTALGSCVQFDQRYFQH